MDPKKTIGPGVEKQERELEAVLSRLTEHNARLSGVLDHLNGVVGRLDGNNSTEPDTTEPPVCGLLSRIDTAQSDGFTCLERINDIISRLERIA